jgi:hypothetical protein
VRDSQAPVIPTTLRVTRGGRQSLPAPMFDPTISARAEQHAPSEYHRKKRLEEEEDDDDEDDDEDDDDDDDEEEEEEADNEADAEGQAPGSAGPLPAIEDVD